MTGAGDTPRVPLAWAGLATSGRRTRAIRAVEHATFGIVPVVITIFVLVVIWVHDGHGEDFSMQYWISGWRLLHGLSPYAGLHAPVDDALAFPYPASAALFFVPFALIPRGVSADLFTGLCIVSPLLSLWILHVRDWRLYGFVMLLAPIVAGWQTSNLTLPLVLGVAALWRFRERPLVAGALVAALISLKPFMWPLALWLLLSRRWRAAAWAVVIGVALNAVSWAVIGGLPQVHRFLRVTASVVHTFRGWGYSVSATLMHFGVGYDIAMAVAVGACLALVIACVVAARLPDERPLLVLIVALVLCASPIVWIHYFALLIVPLAVIRPRLAPIWFVLLALWVCPLTNPAPWQSAVAAAAVCGLTAALLVSTGCLQRLAGGGVDPGRSRAATVA